VRLTEDVLYALVPARHALARRHSLSVSDLRQEFWALDSTSSAYGDFLLNLCRKNGFEPRLNATCKGFEMVEAMVASGCSVSVAPGLRVTRRLDGIRSIRLRPEARRRISVAYRSGEKEHPAVKVFLEELLRSAASLAAQGDAAESVARQEPSE
jgi:DNA-binding transcriptional LysR family regulator